MRKTTSEPAAPYVEAVLEYARYHPSNVLPTVNSTEQIADPYHTKRQGSRLPESTRYKRANKSVRKRMEMTNSSACVARAFALERAI